jgi:hypothetical protein
MADRPILFSGPETERFLDNVSPEPNTGCWLWAGRVNAKGYGRFGNGEMAHRTALRLHGVVIPDDKEVDHLCRVRCCVNPDHLDVVTHRENLLRGDTLAAVAAAATHCPAGHPLSGSNVAVRRGKRSCRECDRLRAFRSYKPRNNSRRRRRKLTEPEKNEIRSLISSGLSHSQIAALFDISVGTVSRVRNGANIG